MRQMAGVMAGFILGQALYGVWIGTLVVFVAAAATIAWMRLPRTDPETPATEDLREEVNDSRTA